MPLFEYRCRGCGHELEALVRPQDTEAPRCPACQSTELEKLLTTFAVSSAEKTQAAAQKINAQRAATARRDNIALHHETEAHLREEHGGG